jgi:hypothetical protein
MTTVEYSKWGLKEYKLKATATVSRARLPHTKQQPYAKLNHQSGIIGKCTWVICANVILCTIIETPFHCIIIKWTVFSIVYLRSTNKCISQVYPECQMKHSRKHCLTDLSSVHRMFDAQSVSVVQFLLTSPAHIKFKN